MCQQSTGIKSWNYGCKMRSKIIKFAVDVGSDNRTAQKGHQMACGGREEDTLCFMLYASP